MLPLLRTTLLGGVFATLALFLAGFAAREPSRPHLAHVMAPARGALIEAGEHPEWRQFLVLAAFRRADELERLRNLPATPMIVEEVQEVQEVIVPEAPEEKVAALPAQSDPEVKEDITGAIQDKPSGVIAVEIGEASSIELPISEQEILPPVRQPETLQRQKDSQRKVRAKRVKLKSKPPAKPAAQPAVPGILSTIFGSERLSAPQ